MARVQPLPESEAQDKVAQTYGRIRELLGVESLPEMFLVYGRVEPFLRDFYMNFKKFVYHGRRPHAAAEVGHRPGGQLSRQERTLDGILHRLLPRRRLE